MSKETGYIWNNIWILLSFKERWPIQLTSMAFLQSSISQVDLKMDFFFLPTFIGGNKPNTWIQIWLIFSEWREELMGMRWIYQRKKVKVSVCGGKRAELHGKYLLTLKKIRAKKWNSYNNYFTRKSCWMKSRKEKAIDVFWMGVLWCVQEKPYRTVQGCWEKDEPMLL